ncbi:vesicle transport v-SNARE 13-like [Andrographis paniculata]|uniref:vesicle transport v-SNARE 13-like n=1 Tax=Andrographis paniculata TaxID=175694 RepID=UPI0021E8347A|nr:vesicle transport v-SNARE 13-like [Andrographis paniculata]
MSEGFESCERQYCELSAALLKKTFSVSRLDGEQRRQKISEIKIELDEADTLIRKMDFEVQSLQPNVKAPLLPKLREYRSDLNFLKSEVKRTASKYLQAARNELLEGGMPQASTASQNQRDRLLASTERLNKSGDRIEESKKVMLESEEIGVSLLQGLHQQRQSLLQTDNVLHGMDHKIGRSSGIVTTMSRRMSRNKWIIGSLILLLLLVIAMILYFKLSK